MKLSSQIKRDTIRSARARLRLEQMRQHSAAGSTKAEAAKAIGLTLGGANTLLYNALGTTTWPLQD